MLKTPILPLIEETNIGCSGTVYAEGLVSYLTLPEIEECTWILLAVGAFLDQKYYWNPKMWYLIFVPYAIVKYIDLKWIFNHFF